MKYNYRFRRVYTMLFLLIFSSLSQAQVTSSVSDIIQNIYELEKDRDPKCYATANRLEDFMYGTPLNEDARNFKIEIQKSIIYYLKQQGTILAKEKGLSKIGFEEIQSVINDLSEYTVTTSGDYLYKLTTGTITIKQKDFRQYSSVSYGYRSLLSVEQDLLYFSESNLLSFNQKALQIANEYINLLTLVTLKIADINARKQNEFTISKSRLKDSWVLILKESKNIHTIQEIKYPSVSKVEISTADENNAMTKKIIEQKINSYEKYNQLAENVFLRNIQVYFARQKWPTDLSTSNELRSFYLESLIGFTTALLQEADKNSQTNNEPVLRALDVQKALYAFLPSYTNTFEDVAFFPNNGAQAISIESYDLDAFRDSGFHWRILGYALDDIKNGTIKSLDPNAAEQLVEGVAQFGVLVLRLAGQTSKASGKKALDIQDIQSALTEVQNLINSYDYFTKQEVASALTSSRNTDTNVLGFEIVNSVAGVDFEHKSSDWLNRLIRGYTTSTEEGVIKLSIPPAFGGSGVACEDINQDGAVDILLLGGFGNKLYLNGQDGTFTDVTAKANINNWNEKINSFGEARQPIIADFDNDGKQDIFITYVNDSHRIYRNLGNLQFKDMTAKAELGGENAVAGPATTFDYDNDGLLDIYIGYFGNYVAGILPTIQRDNQNGMPNKLFRNLGNFKFEEIAYAEDVLSDSGWTQAVGHSDINQDGLQDIIVGNDFGVNKYYFNTLEGKFVEMSKVLGTGKPSYTMNVGITDINGDFFPDFYISNIVVMQKDEKYVSPNADTKMKFDPKKMANIRTVEANDLFVSSKEEESLTYKLSTNIGRGYSATGWSWDADFFDFDNDGDEDLYCLNGMNDFSVYSSENPFYFERAEDQNLLNMPKAIGNEMCSL